MLMERGVIQYYLLQNIHFYKHLIYRYNTIIKQIKNTNVHLNIKNEKYIFR